VSYESLSHPDLDPGPLLDGLSLPPARLYRVRSIVPRARFVDRASVPDRPGDLAARLADPLYDPRRAVLLDGGPEAGGGAPDRDGRSDGGAGASAVSGAKATIVEDRPEKVRLLVDAPVNGYLVLTDAWAPGWRARVDGSPVPILRADGLFRAVRLGAGAHEVVMTYFPSTFAAGLAISILAMATTLGIGIVMKRRHA